MGDAGEGLVDSESRIQERLDELARERAERRAAPVADPAVARELDALRLARAELQRQLESATHPGRRAQLAQAVEEVDKRLSAGTRLA